MYECMKESTYENGFSYPHDRTQRYIVYHALHLHIFFERGHQIARKILFCTQIHAGGFAIYRNYSIIAVARAPYRPCRDVSTS